MDRILTKVFYIVFQVLKVLLIKIGMGTVTKIFYFLLFLLAFTSADIYYKFSELHSTLSEKKDFLSKIFLF